MIRRIGLYAIAVAALCALSLASAATLTVGERAKIHPDFLALVARAYPEIPATGGSIARLSVAAAPGAEPSYHAVVYTSDPAGVRATGAVVNSVYPGFVTAQVTVNEIVRMAALDGVRYIDEGSKNYPLNDVSIPETGASLVQGGLLNNTKYRGAGAIVLVYDTGIDFKHRDFRSTVDSTRSRILFIWDQTLTAQAGEAPPNGFSYGVEYTQAQINAELTASPANKVRERDYNGHGTHVCGTAAGNDSSLYGKFSGMAPDADIIIVKGGDGSFGESQMIDGLTYAQSKATALNKPVAVNWSIGGQTGPHDGSRAYEQAVNSFVSSPGRVVVIAAGNDGQAPIHIGGTAGATTTFTFTVPAYTPVAGTGTNQFLFDLWLSSNQQVSVSARSPNGYTASAAYNAAGSSGDGSSAGDGLFSVFNSPSFTGNGLWDVQLWVRDDGTHYPAAGTWTFTVTNPNTAVHYDGWLGTYIIGSGVVTLSGGDVNETVSMPGTAAGAITAAAYVTKWSWPVYANLQYVYNGTDRTGNIATFSAIGPTRDGRQKPDLAAPGQGIASSLSSSMDTTGLASVIYPGQKHFVDQGTSMATPHITGAAALILGAFPTTTAATIKTLFTGGAIADAFTGSVPNYTWGYGKLDVLESMARMISSGAVVTRTLFAYDGTNANQIATLTGTTKYAVRISPTVSGQLTGVTLNVTTPNNNPIQGVGNITLQAYTNSAGLPGTPLGSAVSFPLTRLNPGTPNYIQMLGAGVTVTSGTDFQIVLSIANASETLLFRYENVTGGTHSSSFNGTAWAATGVNYRIRAIVTTGATATNTPVVTTSAATAVDSAKATLHGTVNPNGAATAAWFEVGTDSTLATPNSTVHQNIASGNSAVAVTQIDTGLVASTVYYYRLAAQNAAGTSRAAVRSFTTTSRSLPAYPATYALKDTVPFPSRTQASDFSVADYRLVGLPGNGAALAGTLLTGTAEKDWRLSWDNGASSNYILRYDGTAAFTFSTGKAFWLLNKGPWVVNTTAPTAPLNASQQVEVPLHAGWNLITDPFNAPLSWTNVQAVNGGLADPIYAYANGAFSQPASFAPYTGYYYFNTPGATLLKVPYQAIVPGSAAPAAADPASWRITIAATSGGGTDSASSLGVAPASQLSGRSLNLHKPRASGALVATTFSRPAWDPDFPEFATDIRAETGGLQQWSFDLRAVQGQPATLRFAGVRRVPASLEVWLIDEQDAMSFDLRRDTVCVMTPASPRCSFSVVVGGHDAVAALVAASRPAEFALGQNYPNPFNPSTTIPVSLPRDGDASLRIFDILGKEVTTLYNGRLEAGRHYFVWSGTDGGGRPVSSGLYIARFQPLNGPALTSKLLLMK